MNKHQIQGNWKQLKGKVKERWGELTDDELDQIDGETDQLVGAIQKRYGKSLEDARKDVDNWRSERGC